MRVHTRAIEDCRRTVLLKLAVGLGAASVFGSSELAHAVSCGDVLGPEGFVVLNQDLVCEESPALIVEGPVVVDLNGFTVSCALAEDGILTGIGIDLTGFRGRVRNGTIENCDKGVVVGGDGRHLLERLTVTSPDVDGDDGIAFQVESSGNRLVHNIVAEFAGEGFRLGDDVPANRNLLRHNEAIENANHGFRVSLGERNLFSRNHAEGNAAEGFRSQDKNNRFVANTAKGNADEGIRLRDEEAQNNLVLHNHIEGNGLDPCNPLPPDEDANPGIGVTRQAANNKIINNEVEGNCIGIAVEEGSLSNKIFRNTASGSSLVDMADGNADCDENEWRRNEFETSVAGPAPGDPSPECIQ